jgi:hypothetical protein
LDEAPPPLLDDLDDDINDLGLDLDHEYDGRQAEEAPDAQKNNKAGSDAGSSMIDYDVGGMDDFLDEGLDDLDMLDEVAGSEGEGSVMSAPPGADDFDDSDVF